MSNNKTIELEKRIILKKVSGILNHESEEEIMVISWLISSETTVAYIPIFGGPDIEATNTRTEDAKR